MTETYWRLRMANSERWQGTAYLALDALAQRNLDAARDRGCRYTKAFNAEPRTTEAAKMRQGSGARGRVWGT